MSSGGHSLVPQDATVFSELAAEEEDLRLARSRASGFELEQGDWSTAPGLICAKLMIAPHRCGLRRQATRSEVSRAELPPVIKESQRMVEGTALADWVKLAPNPVSGAVLHTG